MNEMKILPSVLFLFIFCTCVFGIGDHRASRVLSSFTFKPPYFPDAGSLFYKFCYIL